MRRTYAYNSITIGTLVGILVVFSTESLALGIITMLAVSAVGFVLIRLIENALYSGVDKAVDAAVDAYGRHKAKKASAQITVQNVQDRKLPVNRWPKD